jgi:hypothetical protein
MSNNADYLGTLEAAVLIQHRCKPTHKETFFVEEKTADGEIVWQGDVESFDLTGHEEAKTCYAWQHIDGRGNAKIFAVLRNKFIDSPNKAVQAAIFTDAQPPDHRFSKEMELLKQQLEDCKKFCRQMGMKAEDLAAAIHTGQGIHEATKQRRKSAS